MVGVIWHRWILGLNGECIFITPQILPPNDKKQPRKIMGRFSRYLDYFVKHGIWIN
jgi:hypothetical protein